VSEYLNRPRPKTALRVFQVTIKVQFDLSEKYKNWFILKEYYYQWQVYD